MVADVTVVATARATARRLCRYLEEAGLSCASAADLGTATGPRCAARAYVVLPEDLDPSEIDRAVATWSRRSPRPRIVLVAGGARRAALDGPAAPGVTILPRPAFSWAILDAVVGRSDDSTGGLGVELPEGARRSSHARRRR